jgi:hypothetical protein
LPGKVSNEVDHHHNFFLNTSPFCMLEKEHFLLAKKRRSR